MRRLAMAAVLATVVGCGTGPSGVLQLTVDEAARFSAAPTVDLTGNVSRDPAKETVIVVTVAGGREIVVDTLVGKDFNITVSLNINAENQLAVVAHDASGVISNDVVVTVFHDNTGPTVETSIPSNRAVDVPLNTTIQVKFAEPLVRTGPNPSITLRQNSRAVAGVPTLSADSTFLTFEPTLPLEPMSIYEIDIDGLTDEAGNLPLGGRNVCFVTTVGAVETFAMPDTSTDLFGNGNVVNLIPTDLKGGTVARSGSTLYGLFGFSSDRTLTGATDRASILVDIDLDNDGTTGFRGFKDAIFDTNLPELNSGLGVELVVALDAHFIADSAFVGVNTAELTWDPIDVFLPGVCGRFFGFHTTAILGDSIQDNGSFSLTYTAFAVEDTSDQNSGIVADPVPVSGNLNVNLINPGPPAAFDWFRLPRREFVWRPRINAGALRLLRPLRRQ